MIRTSFNSFQQSRPFPLMAIYFVSIAIGSLGSALAQQAGRDPVSLTHGPMLGQPTANSMVVWGRTSEPGEFTVHYGTDPDRCDQVSQPGATSIERDNTGTVRLSDLQPDTSYYYQVWVNERPHGLPGSFQTLPSQESSRNDKYNPKGLFNFRFQIGSCANQNPLNGGGHRATTYEHLNQDWADKVHFHIMNGDWLYEELRTYSPEAWRLVQGLNDFPMIVDVMPTIVGVWENIVEVVDAHTLRLHMPARVDDQDLSYSIGRRSYGKFRVSNCEFYLIDTRGDRDMHDVTQRDKPGVSMLGKPQREWLLKSMKESDADFCFVISTVPFMIPHSGAGGFEADEENKEEAWTGFFEEREMLINQWDKLGKKVFVMTGDLHNSFAIRITDNVWEFCCGPHNSVNHVPKLDESDRPATGKFKFGPRECDIRWSSYVLPDVPRLERLYPYFCVVQVNNVFNMPKTLGEKRLVAYPHPQIVFQYYDGRTGELAYAEAISPDR